ncbi:general substrate transporter [Plectosphaerella plurivora]|uniref:General substrate transporter n=1 Tax=Plectosphaerella plurivora TaxID=936078 RepID=A0A9P9AGI6_9PEZI|nr:general substrate transporter [Plectosphaerella plurivora]
MVLPTRVSQYANEVTLHLLLLIAIVTLGPLQFGLHLAELNTPQDVITCRKKAVSTGSGGVKDTIKNFWHSSKPEPVPGFFPDCIPMDDAAFSTVSAIFTVGGFIGALASGPFASSRGRLTAMRVTAIVFFLGSVLETLATGVVVLGIGRLLSGIGAGAATVVVPLYISEISPPKYRGFFGTMTQVSTNVGILLTQTLGYFLSHGTAWRYILGAGVIIATAQAFGLLLVPESPNWLAANGNPTKARQHLQRIRGAGYDISEETAAWGGDAATSEQEGLLSPALSDTSRRGSSSSGSKDAPVHLSVFQVARDPLYSRAIVAVVIVMVAQQLGGINAVMMYSTSLLQNAISVKSSLLTILVSVVNLFCTLAFSMLPDKLGRKACILVSGTGQGVAALLLAICIGMGSKTVAALLVVVFVAFFAVGLGPVPFILASEMVGQEAVGATQSWALGANYFATFLVAQFFPIVNNALNDYWGGSGYVFYLFAIFAGVSMTLVMLFVPETKGKRDADDVWGRERRLD